MSSTTPINVRMGELATGGPETEFRALLGSCIGVALFDGILHIGGLAHVVLPSKSGHDGPPGKFANTAVPELLRQMQQLGSEPRNITARFAGGAAMFATGANETIGDKNQFAIEAALEEHHIQINGRHCGGDAGRKLIFRPATGFLSIQLSGGQPIEI